MYENILLHNLDPVGTHIQVDIDDSQVYDISDLSAIYDERQAQFLSFEITGADVYLTVDGKTDPVKDGTVGKPLVAGRTYSLSQGEFRRMRFVSATGGTTTIIGQLYHSKGIAK